jgi:hypothetical protein
VSGAPRFAATSPLEVSAGFGEGPATLGRGLSAAVEAREGGAVTGCSVATGFGAVAAARGVEAAGVVGVAAGVGGCGATDLAAGRDPATRSSCVSTKVSGATVGANSGAVGCSRGSGAGGAVRVPRGAIF